MSLEHLNALRAAKGISPLKSWKGSKQALADAITKLSGLTISSTSVGSTEPKPIDTDRLDDDEPMPVVTVKAAFDDSARVAAAKRKAEIAEQMKLPEDHALCHKCKKPFHLDELDGKDDGTGNFNILHCPKCYGPGYVNGRAPAQLDLEEAIKNAPVTKCPPSAALKAIKSRNDQLDEIAAKRVKGDATAVKLPAAPKAKPVVAKPAAQRKPTIAGTITLADIARELGIDPKIARAKMRRCTVPADIITGKHAYQVSAKQVVIDLLQKDLRKAS